jgi:hypothetical protein
VLVVVCDERDEAGRRLIASWPGSRARRLTAGDLSTAGWRVSFPDDDEAIAVLDGHRIPVAHITAVVVRCPAITAADVPHIASQDRAFVAAEMTAFLAGWLMNLRCRVMNRPTATCLCGPPWRRLQWVRVAADLGIPAEPVCVAASPTGGTSETSFTPLVGVTIVGDACVGEVDDELKRRTRRLAAAAGVELLTAQFSGRSAEDRFVTASVLPDLDDPAILEALHHHAGATA